MNGRTGVRISKTRRQHLIARILSDHEVTSQEQLVDLLAQEDVVATQATVSRDLDEIGAVKVRVPGVDRHVYAVAELPRDQVAPADHLRRVLGEWVIEVSFSQNIVVLRTPPGSAHVVASALDRSGLEGSLGTIAGDDTVLVIAAEDTGGEGLAKALGEIAGQW